MVQFKGLQLSWSSSSEIAEKSAPLQSLGHLNELDLPGENICIMADKQVTTAMKV